MGTTTENPPSAGTEDVDSNSLLVAVGDDIFLLPRSVYTDQKYKLSENQGGIVRELVKYGTALAYIPMSFGIGIGSFCYLLNLNSLRTTPPTPPANP